MWRLRIAEGGGDPCLRTKNAYASRQVWELDAAAEELLELAESRHCRPLQRRAGDLSGHRTRPRGPEAGKRARAGWGGGGRAAMSVSCDLGF